MSWWTSLWSSPFHLTSFHPPSTYPYYLCPKKALRVFPKPISRDLHRLWVELRSAQLLPSLSLMVHGGQVTLAWGLSHSSPGLDEKSKHSPLTIVLRLHSSRNWSNITCWEKNILRELKCEYLGKSLNWEVLYNVIAFVPIMWFSLDFSINLQWAIKKSVNLIGSFTVFYLLLVIDNSYE